MAIYRVVQASFWQDEFVIELTPEEKFFYGYLMTNSKTTQCGIFYESKKLIEIETGYSGDTIDKLIQRFISYGKILYNHTTKEIMIVNWIKHNFINSKNTIACINKELKTVKDKAFINRFYQECKRYEYPLESIFKGIEIIDLNKDKSLETIDNSTVEESPIRDFEGSCEPLGEKEKEKELQKEKQQQNQETICTKEEGVAAEENNATVTLEKVVDFFNNNIHYNARNMSYINGILCNWATLGLATRKRLLDYRNERGNSKKSVCKSNISNAQAYEYVD